MPTGRQRRCETSRAAASWVIGFDQVKRLDSTPPSLRYGEAGQRLTWAARDGAVALLPEGETRQLYGTFVRLGDVLRVETDREPQWGSVVRGTDEPSRRPL